MIKEFKAYPKLKRFQTEEVEGIENGVCWIFPKIDGTNASVWNAAEIGEEPKIMAGSRTRTLSLENDNQGFYDFVLNNEKIIDFMVKYPNLRLYGEWLVPHSLKTYRDSAWRQFYIFDVAMIKEDGEELFLPYEEYSEILEKEGLEYIAPMAKIKNPNLESLIRFMEKNTYLIEEGKGFGEGIVIKNYGFVNKYNRQTWAKLVHGEFKEKHVKAMGCPEVNAGLLVEERIVNDFCTDSFVEKEFAKIVNEKGGWSSKYIGEMLGRIYHELIMEETWNILKKYKYPIINFKVLNSLVIEKIKLVKRDIF